ncbi:MAG: hypothetical protein JWN76_1893 [Chitinophagaceae bacterium]|nr:hypothetical protein [Chitinophagaceae bacterium]
MVSALTATTVNSYAFTGDKDKCTKACQAKCEKKTCGKGDCAKCSDTKACCKKTKA